MAAKMVKGRPGRPKKIVRRMSPAERRKIILDAAVRIAAREGVLFVRHDTVAAECFWPTSVSTVWRLMGDSQQLLRATVKHGKLKVTGL